MLLARSLALLAVSSMLAACSPNGSVTDDPANAGADACARPAAVNGLVAANYDQSCRTYADCMAINTATIDCNARCDDATDAVNVSAAAAVQADYARAPAECRPESCWPVPSGCGGYISSTLLTCVAGRCGVVACDGASTHCFDVAGACSPSCSSDEVCAKHTCRPLCGPDKPCTGGTKCNDATLCLPPPGCELPDGGIADGGCSTVCYGYCE